MGIFLEFNFASIQDFQDVIILFLDETMKNLPMKEIIAPGRAEAEWVRLYLDLKSAGRQAIITSTWKRGPVRARPSGPRLLLPFQWERPRSRTGTHDQ